MLNWFEKAVIRYRTKRVVALCMEKGYKCNKEDLKAIRGACILTAWNNARIGKFIIDVREGKEAA